MANYKNFYENLAEALIRLKNTVVLYDGEPMFIWTITDTHPDGIYRVYMSPLTMVQKMPGNVPAGTTVPHGHASMAPMMDEYMKNNPNIMLRKHMNSPLFNKFRPFPLGMMVNGPNAIYCARQPARPKTEQGLIHSMVFATQVTASPGAGKGTSFDMFSERFRECILGKHLTPKEVLAGLTNPKHSNESAPFNREFALVKGPIDILFLAYREDVIGVLPHGDFSKVTIGKNFSHTKEVVSELNLFYDIKVAA